MYHIYQTRGWILGGINVGESNKFLDIFTSELGLVRCLAQGVRKLNSKLRYGLQDYSFGKISLVKGKIAWRVVGIEKSDEFDWIYEDRKTFQLLCRIFSLLKRLIRGEEQDEAVFEDLNRAIFFIGKNNLSQGQLANFEIVLVFRILEKLGYVGRDERFNKLVDFSIWEPGLLSIDDAMKSTLIKQINNSLAHSHL